MEQSKQYRDPQYIAHILDCIEKIERYLTGITRDDFLRSGNDMMQDAVVRELEIIGEVTKRISQEFWGSHPEVPWHEIAAMRNSIVHDYESVDFVVVWETATEDLPVLKKALTKHP